MDPRTVELLQALQGQEHDAAAFERISGMFNEERTSLKAEDDLGMLSHLGELMEGWAEGTAPELASQALALAARSAEDDLEQPERAIKLLERVLDLEPTTEALEQLADLYMKRGGDDDAQQAADLYAALGETLGGQEGKPYLQRALALVPAHESSIELSRLYATEGKYRDALVCISPLAERGNADAVRMQEAYLVNLDGVVPTKKSKRGESLPPPQVQRPARSGGTMVGFRLDQYHEALRNEEQQPVAEEAPEHEDGPLPDSAEAGGGPSEDSVVRALPQRSEAELPHAAATAPAPAAAIAPAPAPATVGATPVDPSKTMAGIGMPMIAPKPWAAPAAAAPQPAPVAPVAEPAAAPPPAESPGAALAAKVEGKRTMMGVGIPAGFLPGPAPQEPPEPIPTVRKSLPPPNPAIVRASKPTPARASRPSLRSGGSRALAAPAPAAITAPRALLQVAPPGLAEPIAAALPVASAPELAEPPAAAAVPMASAPLEPFTVSASQRPDDFVSKKKPAPSMKLIAGGAAALLAIGLGVFAMMGDDDESSAAASAESGASVSQQVGANAPSAPAAPAPPPAPVAEAPVVPPPAPEAAPPPPAPEPVVEKKARKPKGDIKVAARDIKVRGGKITGTQIMVALEDALPKIESCYSDALQTKPKLAGKLTLGFSIQKTGKIAGARVAKSTVKNKPLESCAVDALEGQRFPKVKKVATVTMPIGLTP